MSEQVEEVRKTAERIFTTVVALRLKDYRIFDKAELARDAIEASVLFHKTFDEVIDTVSKL